MQGFDVNEFVNQLDVHLMVNFVGSILIAETIKFFVDKIWKKIDSMIHSPLDV